MSSVALAIKSCTSYEGLLQHSQQHTSLFAYSLLPLLSCQSSSVFPALLLSTRLPVSSLPAAQYMFCCCGGDAFCSWMPSCTIAQHGQQQTTRQSLHGSCTHQKRRTSSAIVAWMSVRRIDGALRLPLPVVLLHCASALCCLAKCYLCQVVSAAQFSPARSVEAARAGGAAGVQHARAAEVLPVDTSTAHVERRAEVRR